VLLLLWFASMAHAEPPALRPIEYFNLNCARCHGEDGSAYGEGFGAGYDEEGLRQIVREMCEGPGAAPIHGEEFEAQVALHQALAQGLPFAVITTFLPGHVIGECLPGTEVNLCWPGRSQAAEVSGRNWSVVAADLPGAFDVVVVREGRESRFSFPGDRFPKPQPSSATRPTQPPR
jgi:hypothetical protein